MLLGLCEALQTLVLFMQFVYSPSTLCHLYRCMGKPMDLVGWWVGMQIEHPCMAKLALRTLPIPHTGVDVERSFSHYRISRTVLQSASTPEYRIGILSFRMNGVVPPVSNQ